MPRLSKRKHTKRKRCQSKKRHSRRRKQRGGLRADLTQRAVEFVSKRIGDEADNVDTLARIVEEPVNP